MNRNYKKNDYCYTTQTPHPPLCGAGHVARMGEGIVMYMVFLENLRERDHLGDPGVNGIILRWNLIKWDFWYRFY
jgi:hypothetical protein